MPADGLVDATSALPAPRMRAAPAIGIIPCPHAPSRPIRALACTPGFVNNTCFATPAAYKRVYLVDLKDVSQQSTEEPTTHGTGVRDATLTTVATHGTTGSGCQGRERGRCERTTAGAC